ncbi:hypothetical protein GCM10011416_16260 [Polaribacter pacificus]|uniref:Uncharacterized protein n=1 Tax=Polaribacter pacificus TaxID=1775173 RepID=A0A917HZ97_9FLAO|nr:hypothetical protein [Polaribacter pacificus]GGG98772.1 hypothetical protein GCM10011416_16260 [Polaribacter pacificus]
MEAIKDINLEDWLSELKVYQKNSIEQLVSEFGEEEAMEKWLSANGPKDNVPFGGIQTNDSKPFLDKFKAEFKKFICNHPDYEEEHNKLNVESPVTKAIWISIISAALGATLGFAATLLAPVVAIMLSIVGKMGIKAYCEN